MPGTLKHNDTGLWFSVDDRRYHILSPVQLDRLAQLKLTLALYNGRGDSCMHQDVANISTVKGRMAFAQGCPGMQVDTITTDLLQLDAALREEITQETARQTSQSQQRMPRPRCGTVVEGEEVYGRPHIDADGIETLTPLTSFVIIPKMRIEIAGAEAIRADLKTSTQTFRDVTFERHHWHSRPSFLKALHSLDLWCIASDIEVQYIQAIVASKPVPQKQGTRALGYHEGDLWVTADGVLSAEGWLTESPLIYLPHAGASPLEGCVRYQTTEAAQGLRVARAFYERVWRLNDVSVIGPTTGWFFATPFKPRLHRRLKHFPILDCWGTKGAGKTSLLQLFWQLFGVVSEPLSCTETEFALLTLLASTTSIPLVFDEFKPWDMRLEQVRRFERMLRRGYQGEVEHRGRPDLTLVPFRLSAPMAVAGEVPVSTQPALVERIIPVSPSPQWLTEHAEARIAYVELMALPLQAFAPLYIPWTLRRNFDQDFAKAMRVFQEMLGERVLPERVRDNLFVVVFGLCQFEAFAQAHALPVPEQLDYGAMLGPMLEELCTPDGKTRSAVDGLLEHLSTLAEMGRLNYDQHYTFSQDGLLALRLDLCLAEFRKYVRETMLEGEVLSKTAYQRQLRENEAAKGWVTTTSGLAYFGNVRKRAVFIDLARAAGGGLDLEGFSR
jgi:hypothetical protein